jgi:hypothetical protein
MVHLSSYVFRNPKTGNTVPILRQFAYPRQQAVEQLDNLRDLRALYDSAG